MVSFQGRTMGTTYSIKYEQFSSGTISKDQLIKIVEQKLAHINKTMSSYDKTSELSLLNNSKKIKEWLPISEELYRILESSGRISKLTHGIFDVTVGPLVNLWGFGAKKTQTKRVPSDEEIKKVQAIIGHEKIVLLDSDNDKKQVMKLSDEMYIDLSAIAKGHGVDVVSEKLEENGIRNYMVEIGGEVRTSGLKGGKGGKRWRIAIEAPHPGKRNFHRVLDITDYALATSGNYRNYFKAQNKHFSHIINPKTGRPALHRLASVTVIDKKSCMKADALATALMVLGPSVGSRFAETNGIAAYFIYEKNGKFHDRATSHFEKFFPLN